MKINEFQMSDGTILNFSLDSQELKLIFQDWKEQQWIFHFYETIAIQSMSIVGEELSHLTISKDDKFREMTLEHFVDEEDDDYSCYTFFGAWQDRALLKIIAKDSYKIELIV